MPHTKSDKSISIIIPVYNEEKLLKNAVEVSLEKLSRNFNDFEIILVDDGSKDNSMHILKEHFSGLENVHIHANHINLNQGITVQRGMALAKKQYVTFVGVDLALDYDELKEVMDDIGDNDLVILQRKVYAGATNWRLLTSKVNIWIRKLLFPILTSGIRDMNNTQVYRQSILKSILPLAKSPAFTTPEMIMRTKILGYKVQIKDVTYHERKVGKGSLGKLHDILWTIYDMFRFRYLLWIGLEKHGKTK